MDNCGSQQPRPGEKSAYPPVASLPPPRPYGPAFAGCARSMWTGLRPGFCRCAASRACTLHHHARGVITGTQRRRRHPGRKRTTRAAGNGHRSGFQDEVATTPPTLPPNASARRSGRYAESVLLGPSRGARCAPPLPPAPRQRGERVALCRQRGRGKAPLPLMTEGWGRSCRVKGPCPRPTGCGPHQPLDPSSTPYGTMNLR